MSAAPLEVGERFGVVVVSAAEDVDIATAGALIEVVTTSVPNSSPGAVIDLSGVRYVDSAGIRALFVLAERLDRRRQLLRVVVAPDSAVQRVLAIVELATAVPIAASVDEAVAAVKAAAKG